MTCGGWAGPGLWPERVHGAGEAARVGGFLPRDWRDRKGQGREEGENGGSDGPRNVWRWEPPETTDHSAGLSVADNEMRGKRY